MEFDQDRAVAIHEAGHAIVGKARGLDVMEAKIGPPKRRHEGADVTGPIHVRVRELQQPNAEEFERYSNMARHIYGGISAELNYNPDADGSSARCDYENADQISREIFKDDDPKRNAWLGEQFTRSYEDAVQNWDAIIALANALLDRQVLNEAEIQAIYDEHNILKI